MTRYTVYFNGEQVKFYELEEPVVFIGRLPENHIPISNMGISRRHVKIELDPNGGYSLTDLNSLNGTLVNGKKVKKVTLSHGDKITIGKYTIVYEDFRGGVGAAHLETVVTEISPADMRNMAIAAGLKPPPMPTQPMPQFPMQHPIPAAQPARPHPAAAPGAPAVNMPHPAAPVPKQQPMAAPAGIPPAAPKPPAPAAKAAGQPVPNAGAYFGAQQAAAAAPAAVPYDDGTQNGAVFMETSSHIVYKLDRSYLTIGSDEEDDIFATGFMINKGFAAVEQRDGGYYISSLKTMAKFKVNGKSAKSHKLEHRDRIEIGSNTFRFMENG
jgi:pSer/pThr/pTyr-binding forkhead associated (FHA) protein